MTDHDPLVLAAEAALASLMRSARAYAADAKADNTRLAYRRDWQTFAAWCSVMGRQSLPSDGDTLALYIAARADAGAKVATIARALASVAQAHKSAGHPSPRAAAQVQAVLQGIKRRLGTASTQKAALTLDALRAMLATLEGRAIDVRNRALLLLGFAGALRRSELVGLNVEDLQSDRDGYRVTLRRSKTDQEGAGRTVGIPYGSRPETCPVRATQAWLALYGMARGPLFVGMTRAGAATGKRLAGFDVARVIKAAAGRANLDASTLSGHSLRAGLVTSAARAGKPEHVIMRHTGHASAQMLRRYIRETALFEDNAATGIGL